MAVITNIVVRLKAVWAAAGLANVRLVGHLPVADPRPSVLIMLHQPGDQAFPCLIVTGLDAVLIDRPEEDARLETEAHERLRTRLEDRVNGTIQSLEVIAPPLGAWTNPARTGLSSTYRAAIRRWSSSMTNEAKRPCHRCALGSPPGS